MTMTTNRFIAVLCILLAIVHTVVLRSMMWDGTPERAFGTFTAFIFLLISIHFIWKGSK